MTLRLDSPFLESLGVTLREWTPASATLVLPLRDTMLNRSGHVQGGVLCTLLDAAAGYAGLLQPDGHVRRSVTLSLSTQFLERAVGGEVEALGRLDRRGRSVYFASASVRLDGRPIATASGVFKYLDEPVRADHRRAAGAESIPGIAASAHLCVP
ncbi:PaaI family thioesterase [uncultured Hydrogenophaga sp.]|uniref:PaaI family thioesterase n=1 Tax=uncultured Hydrogenophaga sp. TaxID=199683 RepID=UPI00258C324C|nr:PaaI family thioesterase [uncultured Hydrogenophaga sp.]